MLCEMRWGDPPIRARSKRATAAEAIIDLYDFTLAELSILPTECMSVVDQCG